MLVCSIKGSLVIFLTNHVAARKLLSVVGIQLDELSPFVNLIVVWESG